MIPFYITCYNSPALLKRLIGQLDDIVYSGDYKIIISDQSDEKEAQIYREFADLRGFDYVHYRNQGATQAKKSVIAHALVYGSEFCHQISEDFIRVDDSLIYGPVVSGSTSFDVDALAVLRLHPHLAFCKWNAVTSAEGDMNYLYTDKIGTRVYNVHKEVRLPFLTKDILYSNWPATWRVKAVNEIFEKAKTWKAPNPEQEEKNRLSAGEWAAVVCSLGQGSCLVAQPFHHPNRIKPTTSLP